jgi:hypothetical protein
MKGNDSRRCGHGAAAEISRAPGPIAVSETIERVANQICNSALAYCHRVALLSAPDWEWHTIHFNNIPGLVRRPVTFFCRAGTIRSMRMEVAIRSDNCLLFHPFGKECEKDGRPYLCIVPTWIVAVFDQDRLNCSIRIFACVGASKTARISSPGGADRRPAGVWQERFGL